MSDYTIYALKAGDESFPPSVLFESLKSGEGRFGWSGAKTANLYELREKIAQYGWNSLDDDEKSSYSVAFLLNFKADDWDVYINMPHWGQCATAKVTGGYFWRYIDDDFNHRFPVDPASVFVFDRNDAIVHPALSARLKLQGRYWRIYLQEEFEALVKAQKTGLSGTLRTPKANLAFLTQEIRPLLVGITERIHHTHPNSALEALLATTLHHVPGVKEVRWQGGAGDHGADILVIFESGLPIVGLQQQRTCVIQVKSFEGEHWDTKAVTDIRRAFEYYPEAAMGLIVSTSTSSTESLDSELEKLREETGKPVSLLIGADVATFFMRFGLQLPA